MLDSIKAKPVRRRRRKANVLTPVVKEARRQRREMNRSLSQMLSEALGFGVTVRVTMDVPMSPTMKRATKAGAKANRRKLAELFNTPLHPPSKGDDVFDMFKA